MVAVVLGLAAGCCFGWADFLGGLASRRIGARTVVLGGRALSLALLAVPLALIGDSIHGGAVVFGGLAGVAGTVGLLALFRAMELGDIGTAPRSRHLAPACPSSPGWLAGSALRLRP
jgi:drug/metabolite transporter (DMT)-like permease